SHLRRRSVPWTQARPGPRQLVWLRATPTGTRRGHPETRTPRSWHEQAFPWASELASGAWWFVTHTWVVKHCKMRSERGEAGGGAHHVGESACQRQRLTRTASLESQWIVV